MLFRCRITGAERRFCAFPPAGPPAGAASPAYNFRPNVHTDRQEVIWMEQTSIWQREGALPRFPSLEGDTAAEAVIVGGGITGILCA